MRSVILLLSTEPSYGLIKMLPDISLDLGALKPCECDPLLTTTQCNYCLDGRNLCLAYKSLSPRRLGLQRFVGRESRQITAMA